MNRRCFYRRRLRLFAFAASSRFEKEILSLTTTYYYYYSLLYAQNISST